MQLDRNKVLLDSCRDSRLQAGALLLLHGVVCC